MPIPPTLPDLPFQFGSSIGSNPNVRHVPQGHLEIANNCGIEKFASSVRGRRLSRTHSISSSVSMRLGIGTRSRQICSVLNTIFGSSVPLGCMMASITLFRTLRLVYGLTGEADRGRETFRFRDFPGTWAKPRAFGQSEYRQDKAALGATCRFKVCPSVSAAVSLPLQLPCGIPPQRERSATSAHPYRCSAKPVDHPMGCLPRRDRPRTCRRTCLLRFVELDACPVELDRWSREDVLFGPRPGRRCLSAAQSLAGHWSAALRSSAGQSCPSL